MRYNSAGFSRQQISQTTDFFLEHKTPTRVPLTSLFSKTMRAATGSIWVLFQQKHTLSSLGQKVGRGTPSRARADDNSVDVARHAIGTKGAGSDGLKLDVSRWPVQKPSQEGCYRKCDNHKPHRNVLLHKRKSRRESMKLHGRLLWYFGGGLGFLLMFVLF